MDFADQDEREIALDQAQRQDLWDLYHSHPVVKMARQAFDGMAFCQPFIVRMGGAGRSVNNSRMRILIQKEWMPWVREVYDHIKMFGIVCYYFERVDNDYVPRIPPFGSGYMTTLLNKNHKQEFRWYWDGERRRKPDMRMRWIVERKPDLTGHYTSVLAAALHDWKTFKIVREATEMAAFQSVRQPNIFEYRPPNYGDAEDHVRNLVIGEQEAANEALMLPNAARNRVHKVNKAHFAATLRKKDMLNANIEIQESKQVKPHLWSEDIGDRQRREHSSWTRRSLTLNPHFHYVRAQPPSLPVHLKDISQRLDQFISNLMDFPLELAAAMHATRSANIEGNLLVASERVKDVLSKMEEYIKEAYLYSYGDILRRSLLNDATKLARLKKSPITMKELIELYQQYKVEVQLLCTPLSTYTQLRQYWVDGIMTKEDFAHHAFHINSIPYKEININQDPPLEKLGKRSSSKGKQELNGALPANKRAKNSEERK